jgi:hypothetical protein
MDEFQYKKKVKKLLFSKTVLVVVAFITILLMKGAWGVVQKENESRIHMEAIAVKLTEAKDRESELKKDIEELSTGAGMEKEIRSKFDVRKAGEEVVIVIEPKKSEVEEQVIEKSWWVSIENWFSGLVN